MANYFAYGSNMDLEQMKTRCPRNYNLLGVGKLEGWEFFINSRGVANIIMDENSKVYGLLFEITKRCLNCLDMHEGYPKIYGRSELSIRFKGKEINAWVYIDNNFREIGKPRTNYLERIIKVAENKEFRFPGNYIKHLKSFY